MSYIRSEGSTYFEFRYSLTVGLNSSNTAEDANAQMRERVDSRLERGLK